jgi:hypothetical protein
MDKVIGWLMVASAAASFYLSFLDPTRVFVG